MRSTLLPITGWIFDLYPTSGGMVVWIVDETGGSHRLLDPFAPSFYAAGPVKELRRLAADLAKVRLAEPVGMTRRQEFWTGEPRDVLELVLRNPEQQPALLRQLATPRPGIVLYDCDLSPALTYCHAKEIFPLAKVTVARGMTNDQWQMDTEGPGPEFDNSQFAIRNCNTKWRALPGIWSIRSRRSP